MPKRLFQLYVIIQTCLGSWLTHNHNIALSLSMQTQALPVWGISLNETTFILCGTTFFRTHVWRYIEAGTNEGIFKGGESGSYATTTKFRLSVGDLLNVSHHRLSEMSLRGRSLFHVPPCRLHTVSGASMHRRIWKKRLLSKLLTRTTYCMRIVHLVEERWRLHGPSFRPFQVPLNTDGSRIHNSWFNRFDIRRKYYSPTSSFRR